MNKQLQDKVDEILDFYFWSIDKSKDTNRSNIHEAKTAILQLFKDTITQAKPEIKTIVELTEPPQGIDRLWLRGRDYGVTAGYNQGIQDYETNVLKALNLEKVEGEL